MTITAKLGGDFHVGGLVRGGDPEDQTASKDEGLGCRTGPHQGFQPGSL
jgi:hypothetical protein